MSELTPEQKEAVEVVCSTGDPSELYRHIEHLLTAAIRETEAKLCEPQTVATCKAGHPRWALQAEHHFSAIDAPENDICGICGKDIHLHIPARPAICLLCQKDAEIASMHAALKQIDWILSLPACNWRAALREARQALAEKP